ncbi:MAG: hypothetical protein KIG62_03390 [Oscillospiraceae bacterium]|nr:hypothetical protein [Oscillospiraceae bacterium]
MLKHIPYNCYDDDEITYRDSRECFADDYLKIYNGQLNISPTNGSHRLTPDVCARNWIDYDFSNLFDERGMGRLIMLVAGMLFCIENGGIADDDPVDLAYNTWLVIQDFNTGEFDDLFRPGDLKELKSDIKKIMDYFDQLPKLKG